MFTQNTTNGSVSGVVPDGNPSPPVQPPRTAGIHEDLGKVLARIPDLDPKTAAKTIAKFVDGRIIGQALSTKMIFGLGAGLVLGALLPFLFGKTPKPVRELPAWNVRSAEPATEAPKWQPAPPAAPTAPQAAAVGIVPPPPPLGDYRPAALDTPSWRRPQPPAADPLRGSPPAAPPPVNNVNQDYAGPPPARPDDRGYGPATADSRGDPAAPYRNSPGDDYRDYRGTPLDPGTRRDGPVYGAPADERYRNVANPYVAPPSGSLAPSGGNGGAPAQRVDGDYRYQQDNDSGVVHFQGTITAPPGRTN